MSMVREINVTPSNDTSKSIVLGFHANVALCHKPSSTFPAVPIEIGGTRLLAEL